MDTRTTIAPRAIVPLLLITLVQPTSAQLGDRTAEVRTAAADGPARSIILFVGDGMGDSEITLARNYALGAAGRLAMDSLPFSGEYHDLLGGRARASETGLRT